MRAEVDKEDKGRLNAALAVHLKGWVLEHSEWGDLWTDGSDSPLRVIRRADEWNPASDKNDMLLVVEAMETKGYDWHVWPLAAAFHLRHKTADSAGFGAGCGRRGHIANTATAAPRAIAPEVAAEVETAS